MTTTEANLTTTDLSIAAWLAANGMRCVRATCDTTGQVTFAFDDASNRGRALIGDFMLDERLQRYAVWRGRLAGTIRRLRESGRTSASAEEVEAMHGRR